MTTYTQLLAEVAIQDKCENLYFLIYVLVFTLRCQINESTRLAFFDFFPQTYSFIWPYLFSFSTLLEKQIFHSTRLFGPLILLFIEIYLKY